jgi:hypothetical protein
MTAGAPNRAGRRDLGCNEQKGKSNEQKGPVFFPAQGGAGHKGVPVPDDRANRKIEFKLLQRWRETTSAGALGGAFYIGVGLGLRKRHPLSKKLKKHSAARLPQARP